MALLHDPLPVTPRHGQQVDGREIELRWAPVDHPDHYRVQIARDASFADVVFEEVVPGTTVALTVMRRFPEPGRRFYWRVFAGKSENWSDGDHTETFVSGTLGADALDALPDEEEPLGPVSELFRTASLQAGAQHGAEDPAARDAMTRESEQVIEGVEIVTLGMTLILAAGIAIAAILIFVFFAC